MVGEAGIEPTTPGLEGRCSIQLSYSPLMAFQNLGGQRDVITAIILGARIIVAELHLHHGIDALVRPLQVGCICIAGASGMA